MRHARRAAVPALEVVHPVLLRPPRDDRLTPHDAVRATPTALEHELHGTPPQRAARPTVLHSRTSTGIATTPTDYKGVPWPASRGSPIGWVRPSSSRVRRSGSEWSRSQFSRQSSHRGSFNRASTIFRPGQCPSPPPAHSRSHMPAMPSTVRRAGTGRGVGVVGRTGVRHPSRHPNTRRQPHEVSDRRTRSQAEPGQSGSSSADGNSPCPSHHGFDQPHAHEYRPLIPAISAPHCAHCVRVISCP